MNAADLMEKILSEAPSFELGGVTYLIVERDRKIRHDQLEAYAQGLASAVDPNQDDHQAMSEHLVVATVDDRMMRWERPTVLTWTIDETSFANHPDWRETAREICGEATADWNEAAREQEVYEYIRFEPAAPGQEPDFTFAYDSFPGRPDLLALAFFPSDPPAERTVYIGPGTFTPGLTYDRVGIIRHELGHVLGFRHEHIRPESREGLSEQQKEEMEKWVVSIDGREIGAEAITEFDGQSVMHYPLNNLGTLDFELTTADKNGFGKLYRMDADDPGLKEFPV